MYSSRSTSNVCVCVEWHYTISLSPSLGVADFERQPWPAEISSQRFSMVDGAVGGGWI
jgi:hypothetical protein